MGGAAGCWLLAAVWVPWPGAQGPGLSLAGGRLVTASQATVVCRVDTVSCHAADWVYLVFCLRRHNIPKFSRSK
jgi:hypothetical protein